MENIVHEISELLSTLTFLPSIALQLAFLGAILLVLFFALALIIASFSNLKSLAKKLLLTIKSLATLERVDEENVEFLNAELGKLPEIVADGWGRFMEQRLGYPSDYMKEKSVLDENTYSSKNTVAKTFFRIFGFLAVALVATLSTLLLADDAANIGLADFIKDFKVVGGIVGSVAIPVLFYIIFSAILHSVSRKQKKRLQMVYKSFLDTLDEKVVIFASQEEEFVSDNLEQMALDIESIIAQRMDEKEIAEVMTAPAIDELETNILDDIVEEEIVEEVIEQDEQEIVVAEPSVELVEDKQKPEAEEVAVSPVPEEERQSYLAVLISIVEKAINDPEVKREELEEIAELIYNSKSAFVAQEDIAILDECLSKLADIFFKNE
ncbi:MAG: hypothetical protein GX242_01445 [Clostridiales bacterium]|nr:hypothetical protein [Clostridiales bacterium]